MVTAQDVLDEMEVKRKKKMKEATAALKLSNEKARKEQKEKASEALEYRLKVYRDMGASEEEVREAEKRHLRRMGRSGGEVEAGDGDRDLGVGGKGDEDVEMRDVHADADADKGGKEAEV